MRYLTVLLLMLLVGSVSAQPMLVGSYDFLPLEQAALGELAPVPEGQMRGMVHWHTWRSDGYLSTRTSVLWAQWYGSQFLMISDHAHKLLGSSVILDSYPKISGEYRVEVGKQPIDAPGYVGEIAGVNDAMPVGAWLEVGEESHFLVFMGYGRMLKETATRIVQLGCQTKTLGTQKVIEEIDTILQETGGFMVQAHPMNSGYPFRYNFDGCKSAVGVEFFNGYKSEHWKNFERLLEVQRHSARPVIATAGVDLHIPEGVVESLEGAIGDIAAHSFGLGDFMNPKSYRPSRRFTYIYGVSQNPTVIACQIRDARGYCAMGDTVITDISGEPGTKYCPSSRGDVFYVKAKGLPESVKTMKVAFVDDETSSVGLTDVPWTDDCEGTRVASFSIDELRRDATCSGKLIMATTEFVTSAVIILGHPQAIAKAIEQEKSDPVIEAPAVPITPAIVQSAAPPSPPAQVQQAPEFTHILRGPGKFCASGLYEDYAKVFRARLLLRDDYSGVFEIAYSTGQRFAIDVNLTSKSSRDITLPISGFSIFLEGNQYSCLPGSTIQITVEASNPNGPTWGFVQISGLNSVNQYRSHPYGRVNITLGSQIP